MVVAFFLFFFAVFFFVCKFEIKLVQILIDLCLNLRTWELMDGWQEAAHIEFLVESGDLNRN